MSERGKKQFADPVFKQKFNELMKDAKRRERISQSLKEYYKSPESREKLSQCLKATWTKERRHKCSEKAKERGQRKEYKKKMSAVAKRRWADDDYRKSMSGKNNPIARAIDQMSLDDEYIRTFETIKEAEDFLCVPGGHSNIVACANGRQKTAYGFKWNYTAKREEAWT